MDSNLGPKIDHSCGKIFPDDDELNNFIVSTGGSSHNMVYSQTEIFDAEDESWILVSEDSKGIVDHFQFARLRSASLGFARLRSASLSFAH